jgi:hypothetical protein
VNISEPREKVAQAVASRGYRSQVVLDTSGRTSDLYQVVGTPTSYLIGRDGLMVGGAIGPRPWTQAAARSLLQTLLEKSSGQAR